MHVNLIIVDRFLRIPSGLKLILKLKLINIMLGVILLNLLRIFSLRD